MRYVYPLLLAFVGTWSGFAADQKEAFGIFLNPDLYPQNTPQKALESAIGAIERDRTEYLLAHLLDPGFVKDRLNALTPYYEKLAADQIASTGQGMKLKGTELQDRVRERGLQLNFKAFAEAVRQKLADEPTNIKELKLFLSDGKFSIMGDTAQVTHRSFKDKTIFFKKIGERWYLENRKDDSASPKE